MRNCIVLAVVGVAIIAAVPGVASASHTPTGAPLDQDFASGSGTYAGDPASIFRFDARSAPLGENPTGSVYFEQLRFFVEGPVTCLIVEDNRAVLGMRVERSNIGVSGLVLSVTDNRGIGPDLIQIEQASPDPVCTPSTEEGTPVTGDIVVHDAPGLPTSKDQCKHGGWQSFGVFKNQGDCVSFVATGGKNPPGQ